MIKISFPVLVLIAFFTLTLSGCGRTNVFRSLEGDKVIDRSDPTAVISAMQRYNDLGQFDNSLSLEGVVESNPQSTATQKSIALALKGQAITGKAGLTGVQFGSAISNSSSSSAANLLSILPVISTQSATNAAAALNEAQEIASSNGTPLNTDLQLSRAAANTSVIVSKVSSTFTQNSDGTFVANTGPANTKAALHDLLAVDSEGNTILDYATNAQDALNKGADLNDSQRAQLDKIPLVTADLATLNNATLGSGSYSYVDRDNITHTITSSSTQAETQLALNHILSQANK